MPPHAVVGTGHLPRAPWRNGAGTTREVALFPGGAGPEDFAWRISVADIPGDAEFSTFRGADRNFLLAAGGTLTMDVNGVRRVVSRGRPESFSGEDQVSVMTDSGPVTAINLITRRSACTGAMDVRHIDGHFVPDPAAVAVVLLAGTATTGDGRSLNPLDFLLCSQGKDPDPGPESILHCRAAVVATLRVR